MENGSPNRYICVSWSSEVLIQLIIHAKEIFEIKVSLS